MPSQRFILESPRSSAADGSWGNPLETALATATLQLHQGIESTSIHAAQDTLVHTQLTGGSWQACPYYIGIDPPGPPPAGMGRPPRQPRCAPVRLPQLSYVDKNIDTTPHSHDNFRG